MFRFHHVLRLEHNYTAQHRDVQTPPCPQIRVQLHSTTQRCLGSLVSSDQSTTTQHNTEMFRFPRVLRLEHNYTAQHRDVQVPLCPQTRAQLHSTTQRCLGSLMPSDQSTTRQHNTEMSRFPHVLRLEHNQTTQHRDVQVPSCPQTRAQLDSTTQRCSGSLMSSDQSTTRQHNTEMFRFPHVLRLEHNYTAQHRDVQTPPCPQIRVQLHSTTQRCLGSLVSSDQSTTTQHNTEMFRFPRVLRLEHNYTAQHRDVQVPSCPQTRAQLDSTTQRCPGSLMSSDQSTTRQHNTEMFRFHHVLRLEHNQTAQHRDVQVPSCPQTRAQLDSTTQRCLGSLMSSDQSTTRQHNTEMFRFPHVLRLEHNQTAQHRDVQVPSRLEHNQTAQHRDVQVPSCPQTRAQLDNTTQRCSGSLMSSDQSTTRQHNTEMFRFPQVSDQSTIRLTKMTDIFCHACKLYQCLVYQTTLQMLPVICARCDSSAIPPPLSLSSPLHSYFLFALSHLPLSPCSHSPPPLSFSSLFPFPPTQTTRCRFAFQY